MLEKSVFKELDTGCLDEKKRIVDADGQDCRGRDCRIV